jgi:nickel-dependent lactate racemase
MQIEVPYLKDKISIIVDDNHVAGVFTGNDVPIGDESAVIERGIKNPLNSPSLADFLKGVKDTLFIVNDATRPTPTARVLESVFKIIKPSNPKFLVATGTHPAPTREEYTQIFGRYYETFKARIFAHDCQADRDMVYLGKSRNGTTLSINKMVLEASRIIVISSVEPHYFAGYTGGRKSLFPGVAAFKSIEQNHKFAMEPGAKALALEGNPVHEDMVDAMEFLKNKEMFAIMTVLEKDHRIFAATSGNINDSFFAAVEEAEKVFVVKIKEKADIVVTVARYPMDINLYQSQKALDNGKLALKDNGILILVSSCRMGVGDDSFIRLLSSCNSPADVFARIKESYNFGAHKAAKLTEINLWAEMYGVTGLPDDVLKSVFIKPFPSLQDAIDAALKKKGKQAKVLFLLDGSLTVPML